jgi:hypothetical protein
MPPGDFKELPQLELGTVVVVSHSLDGQHGEIVLKTLTTASPM